MKYKIIALNLIPNLQYMESDYSKNEISINQFERLTGLNYLNDTTFSEDLDYKPSMFEKSMNFIARNYFFEQNNIKRFQEIMNSSPKTYFAQINDQVGFGLFANQDIPRLSVIGLYGGIIDRIDRIGSLKNAFSYFPLGNVLYYINGTKSSNQLKLVNSSSLSNVMPKHIWVENKWHVLFVAYKDIPKNNQILINYGKDYGYYNNIDMFDMDPETPIEKYWQ